MPHVFMRQNDGFRILYWMIKDALMYRLGAVTVDLEDVEEKRRVPVQDCRRTPSTSSWRRRRRKAPSWRWSWSRTHHPVQRE